MGKKTKASILTFSVSVINSLATIIFGLLYNNYLIINYGSGLNGLISTLTQFVSLFSIIEGGFTTAAVVAVYSPIVSNNYEQLNGILYTTKKIYIRLGSIITLLVLIFGSVYIYFIDSPVSYSETFLLLATSVMITTCSLCFLSKYTVLLQGDNKEYIQVLLSLISRLLTWLIGIGLIIAHCHILVVFLVNLFDVILNLVLVKFYEKKNYKYVTYKGVYEKNLIKGTKDVLFQKIANTVFTSTDLILISTLISFQFASVYNLYFQIFKSVLNLLGSLAQAPFNSFGQLYKEEGQELKFKEYFDIYQYLVMISSTIVLTALGMFIIPFVKVYSKNITDFNYIYPSLALLFYSQIFSQIINRPYGLLLNATGNFKMQNLQCGLAAVVNVIVSVAFIDVWGINSIILGSFIGTMVILVMNVYQVYKKVLKTNAVRVVVNIASNYMVGFIIIFLSMSINSSCSGYLGLFMYGLLLFVISLCALVTFNILLDKKRFQRMTVYLYDKLKQIIESRSTY